MSALFVRRIPPVFAIALAFFVSGCGVNNIPTFEEQAKAKWSDVQNQYQRRADLIPNLVETVKGYAAQERQTLEAVVKARARGNADQGRRQHRHRSRHLQEVPGGAGAIVGRARPPDRDGGELSRPEIEPEFPGAAVAA